MIDYIEVNKEVCKQSTFVKIMGAHGFTRDRLFNSILVFACLTKLDHILYEILIAFCYSDLFLSQDNLELKELYYMAIKAHCFPI